MYEKALQYAYIFAFIIFQLFILYSQTRADLDNFDGGGPILDRGGPILDSKFLECRIEFF